MSIMNALYNRSHKVCMSIVLALLCVTCTSLYAAGASEWEQSLWFPEDTRGNWEITHAIMNQDRVLDDVKMHMFTPHRQQMIVKNNTIALAGAEFQPKGIYQNRTTRVVMAIIADEVVILGQLDSMPGVNVMTILNESTGLVSYYVIKRAP